MQFKTLISFAALLATVSAEVVTGKLGNATIITDNPAGVAYVAVFEGKVTGNITFTSAGGKGVKVTVDVSGFTGEPGPFGYHIHDQPVPSDGNCTGTKAHLDPYQRGQEPACDKDLGETCELGDLAGKHGKIPGTNSTETTHFTAQYEDFYISAMKGVGAYFGNRSVVIHRADAGKTRLVCANITQIAASGTDDVVPLSTGGASANSTGNGTSHTSTPSQSVSTGSASTYGSSALFMIGGALVGLVAAL